MTKPYILGIDPGLDGALAFCSAGQVRIFDMPTRSVVENKKKKRKVCLDSLAQLLDIYASSTVAACIEAPSAAPGQGVSSMFNFGFSCGVVQGMVAAHRIPLHTVRPAIWKGALGLSSDKNQSRKLAARLVPAIAAQLSRVKDDGRAEAVLLAYWLAKTAT